MINWHDYANNNTIIPLFLNTVGQDGTAATISNAGIGIFVDNNQSFLTTGVTLLTNFASRTGIHVINIASGTITGTNVNCTAFYTSGTVDGINVANRTVGIFSVGRYGQAPSGFSNMTISNGAVVATLSGDLTSTMKTSVNTEVLDVLNVDTFAQPGQGTPPATATPLQMVSYLYKAWRNRKSQTSSEYILYNDDAVTSDQKAAISGSTTVVVGEVTSGP
jgi:hypothetical protein